MRQANPQLPQQSPAPAITKIPAPGTEEKITQPEPEQSFGHLEERNNSFTKIDLPDLYRN